jgi:hypothetical protein
MYRMRLLTLFMFATASSLWGQDRPVTLAVTQGSGSPNIVVTNNSAASLTAFVATADLGSSDVTVKIYYDIYTNYMYDSPILSGRSVNRPLPFVVEDRIITIPHLRAALFSDGKVWGEAIWIDKLLSIRRAVSDQLDHVSGVLRSVSTANLPKRQILEVVQRERDLRKQAHADRAFEERLHEDRIFEIVSRNVGGRMFVNGKQAEPQVALVHLDRIFRRWRESLAMSSPSLNNVSVLTEQRRPFGSVERKGGFGPNLRAHLLPAALTAALSGSCPILNVQVDVAGPDSCGNVTFDLQAKVNRVTIDGGLATSFGVCTGDHDNCSGVFVPPGFQEGGAPSTVTA